MPESALATWSTSRPAPFGEASLAAGPARTAELCAQAPRLRRLVHRLLGWRAAAADIDDVVQDTLLAALRHQQGFRGDAALSTWLTRIALRKVHDHVASARRRRRLFTLFGLLGDREATVAASPDADGDRLDATRQAMQRLAHGDREVLVLRYLEQRAIDEIADLLQCSRAAIDARLSRARQRLRQLLDQEEPA